MKLLLLSVLLSVKFQTFDIIKHANSTQSKSLKDSITLYIELGDSCFGNKKYKEAIKYYEVALVLAEKNKDISLQADINVKIGDVYSRKGVKYESVSYFKKAQSLYGITKNTKKKLGLNIKIGDIYCKMEDSYEAIASYNTSLQEYRKMASYKDIAATLCRIAKVYEIQGQYDQGLDFLAQSSENIKKLHDSSDIDGHIRYL
jgi:tetratricopeptide (TPR) repeat protein